MSKLVTVRFETTLGAHYTFPDLDSSIFEKVLMQEEAWRRLGAIALSNASGACLVVPTRIIETILVDGVIRWTASNA